eukprot:GILK01005838.1.p1 GENE.GILK01005838.1~~GILK01005838.1.p1  ORF type:complete len:605 (-),score=117.29 GILK01005838.1:157-1815(-)
MATTLPSESSQSKMGSRSTQLSTSLPSPQQLSRWTPKSSISEGVSSKSLKGRDPFVQLECRLFAKMYQRHTDPKQLFQSLSLGKKVVSTDKVEAYVRSLQPDISPLELQAIVQKMDTNKDGFVTQSDFDAYFGEAIAPKQTYFSDQLALRPGLFQRRPLDRYSPIKSQKSSEIQQLVSESQSLVHSRADRMLTIRLVRSLMDYFQTRPARPWFTEADQDRDARLSYGDMIRFLKKHHFRKIPEIQLAAVCELIDSKKQGYIDYHEFVENLVGGEAMQRLQQTPEFQDAMNTRRSDTDTTWVRIQLSQDPELRQLSARVSSNAYRRTGDFDQLHRQLDKDQDNVLSAHELRSGLSFLGADSIDPAVEKKLFTVIDRKSKGYVNSADFRRFLDAASDATVDNRTAGPGMGPASPLNRDSRFALSQQLPLLTAAKGSAQTRFAEADSIRMRMAEGSGRFINEPDLNSSFFASPEERMRTNYQFHQDLSGNTEAAKRNAISLNRFDCKINAERRVLEAYAIEEEQAKRRSEQNCESTQRRYAEYLRNVRSHEPGMV